MKFVLNQDIEEKAPLLQQQRKDYDAALITIDKLTLKLEDAMKVLSTCISIFFSKFFV